MMCDCFSRLDKELKERNLQLAGYALLQQPRLVVVPTIQTEWRDASKAPRGKKRNPPAVMGSHCPFCGTPAEPEFVRRSPEGPSEGAEPEQKEAP